MPRARRQSGWKIAPASRTSGLSLSIAFSAIANLLRETGDRSHCRVLVGKQLVLQTQGMQFTHPVCHRVADQRPHKGLSKRAIERKVYFGNTRGRRKAALICHVIAAERPDIVQRSCFASHDPISEREIGVGGFRGLVLENRLIKAGRERIDQVDIARELSMLFLRDASGNEDAEMPNGFMDRIDDRLPVGPDVIDAVVEIENPIERLLGRGDVVAFRAEYDDR